MIDLGRVGVWSSGLRFGDPGEARDAASEWEELGYGALWIPGGAHPGTLDAASALLAATRSIPVATGIVNIWTESAAAIAAHDARIRERHPGRFLLGLGVSHAPVIGDDYRRPLSAMRDYVDALDAAEPPVSENGRVLGALGPRMLELARDRSAGSHPYLTTPSTPGSPARSSARESCSRPSRPSCSIATPTSHARPLASSSRTTSAFPTTSTTSNGRTT